MLSPPHALADGFLFVAGLSGDQEVTMPPGGVETRTSGRLQLRFDAALTKAHFVLRVRRGELITQAHLHCARAGVNGPIVVFLFNQAPIPGPGGINVNGVLSRGMFDNFDIEVRDIPFEDNESCGVRINNIASLLAAVRDGLIYVNVHSEANLPGEVRGQIFDGGRGVSDDDKDDDDRED